MKSSYKLINNSLGWLLFVVSLTVYILTLEPSVSYWDCGEFITISAKLMVGHPMGASLFQILGSLFAALASSDETIPYMVNSMSAVSSAFTIMFLFWTITYLTRRLMNKPKEEKLKLSEQIIVFSSGVVGALAFCFSDTFWFTAVETEVYNMSTLFLAMIFWVVTKWESGYGKDKRNFRWLILICYLIGLSVGVQVMSLLVIPAVCILVIFKKYKIDSPVKFVLANIVSISILAILFKFFFPAILKYFSIMEIFFVNSVGMPFNIGSLIAGLLLFGLIIYGLMYSIKRNNVLLNKFILCFVFLLVGFSSWLMFPIRANSGITINLNNPDNARELLAYYNREQYGELPLLYGSYFTAHLANLDEEEPYSDGIKKYEKNKEKGIYEVVNNHKLAKQNLSRDHDGLFPRLWSGDHVQNYQQFLDYKRLTKPTLMDNISFFLEYQLGYMYWRYFMWNFSGRQNDIQGKNDIVNGNWISGFKVLDESRIGPQTNLPSSMKNNPGRNVYFMLPFLIGVLGMVLQYQNDKKIFYSVLLFFLFTGIAVILYSNVRPFEPRERDYSVVGSFYVFSIWIGLGVYAFYNLFEKLKNQKVIAIVVSIAAFLCVPILMASENWDDHDRSGRYSAREMSKMYLNSCDENAILFTIGDNDTYPLWCVQEVDGYRRDVRAINTSLFNTDWYIDQAKRKWYEADPLPMSLDHNKYRYGSLEVAYRDSLTNNRWNIKDFIKWLDSDDKETYFQINEFQSEKFYPTNKLRIPVDKEKVLKSGIVQAKDSALIVPYIDIDIDESGIIKKSIMMLDVLAENDWERPIYFTGGSFADDEYIWLKDYLQVDGLSYKLVPIKYPVGDNLIDLGRIDSKRLYDRVMSFDWDYIKTDIYADSQIRRSSLSVVLMLTRLIEALMKDGFHQETENIIELLLDKYHYKQFYNESLMEPLILGYYDMDKPEKGRGLAKELMELYREKIIYYSQFEPRLHPYIQDDIVEAFSLYRSIISIFEDRDEEIFEDEKNKFDVLLDSF